SVTTWCRPSPAARTPAGRSPDHPPVSGTPRPASRHRRAAAGSPAPHAGSGPTPERSPRLGSPPRWSSRLLFRRPDSHRQLIEETAPRPGVARRSHLFDGDEQRVTVAVQRHRLHVLVVAGGRALHPILAPATRPVRGAPGGQRP